jgi:hypothetical protein
MNYSAAWDHGTAPVRECRSYFCLLLVIATAEVDLWRRSLLALSLRVTSASYSQYPTALSSKGFCPAFN